MLSLYSLFALAVATTTIAWTGSTYTVPTGTAVSSFDTFDWFDSSFSQVWSSSFSLPPELVSGADPVTPVGWSGVASASASASASSTSIVGVSVAAAATASSTSASSTSSSTSASSTSTLTSTSNSTSTSASGFVVAAVGSTSTHSSSGPVTGSTTSTHSSPSSTHSSASASPSDTLCSCTTSTLTSVLDMGGVAQPITTITQPSIAARPTTITHWVTNTVYSCDSSSSTTAATEAASSVPTVPASTTLSPTATLNSDGKVTVWRTVFLTLASSSESLSLIYGSSQLLTADPEPTLATITVTSTESTTETIPATENAAPTTEIGLLSLILLFI